MKRLNAPYYLSAYGIARQNGFEGTEEDWLLSLKGEPGPQGERGPQGVRGLTGERGPAGKNGWTYVPSVNAEGYMLWNTVISAEGLPETLPAVNIRGPQGPQGPAYELTEKDKNLIAESVMAMLDVKEPEEPNQSVEGAGGSADWSQNSEDGPGQ